MDVIAVGAVVMAARAAFEFVNPVTTSGAGFAGVPDDFLIARIDIAGLGCSLVREHAVLLFLGAYALGKSGHGGWR